jgi:hypothetical protein
MYKICYDPLYFDDHDEEIPALCHFHPLKSHRCRYVVCWFGECGSHTRVAKAVVVRLCDTQLTQNPPISQPLYDITVVVVVTGIGSDDTWCDHHHHRYCGGTRQRSSVHGRDCCDQRRHGPARPKSVREYEHYRLW